jgi:hypothetical protein
MFTLLKKYSLPCHAALKYYKNGAHRLDANDTSREGKIKNKTSE